MNPIYAGLTIGVTDLHELPDCGKLKTTPQFRLYSHANERSVC